MEAVKWHSKKENEWNVKTSKRDREKEVHHFQVKNQAKNNSDSINKEVLGKTVSTYFDFV